MPFCIYLSTVWLHLFACLYFMYWCQLVCSAMVYPLLLLFSISISLVVSLYDTVRRIWALQVLTERDLSYLLHPVHKVTEANLAKEAPGIGRRSPLLCMQTKYQMKVKRWSVQL